MRKQMIGAAGVAILASLGLAACNFGGSDEKAETDATEEAGSGAEGGSGEASSGGKPALDGGSGAETGGESGASGSGSGGDSASGGKPADDAGSGGGSSGASGASQGSQGASSGGGQPTAQEVQAHFSDMLSGYLDHYVQQFGQGLRRTNIQDVVVPLQAGSEYRWNVNLDAGRTYAFFGACDNDCSDVDLVVEDAQGNQLASDLLTDDFPIVAVNPQSSGRYTARIILVSCSVEPCFVGGRVLQQ